MGPQSLALPGSEVHIEGQQRHRGRNGFTGAAERGQMIPDEPESNCVESLYGREFEEFGGEGRRLELWIEDPEIGEPTFRWFESDTEDLVGAFRDHIAHDGTDEVTEVIETSLGCEWVIAVSTYAGSYRVWAKLRDH